jgi:hypothetical protein
MIKTFRQAPAHQVVLERNRKAEEFRSFAVSWGTRTFFVNSDLCHRAILLSKV